MRETHLTLLVTNLNEHILFLFIILHCFFALFLDKNLECLTKTTKTDNYGFSKKLKTVLLTHPGSDQVIDNVSERSFESETEQELDDEEQPVGLEENDRICLAKKDRKTKYVCYHCGRYLCMEHAIFVCENCTRSQDE